MTDSMHYELASVSFGHSPTRYKVHLGPGLMAPVPFECRTVQDHMRAIEDNRRIHNHKEFRFTN